MGDSGHSLTESQEALLVRYYDGECGFFGHLQAQQLIKKSCAAREYLDDLVSVNRGLRFYSENLPRPSADLWKRIERRIVQEERLQAVNVEGPGFIGMLLEDIRRLGWGMAGGLVAAGLAVVVANSSSVVPASGHGSVATNNHVQAVQLASGHSGSSSLRQSSDGFLSAPKGAIMAIDWVRSAGKVNVIRHPSQSSTVFWIQQKEAALEKNAAAQRDASLPEPGGPVDLMLQSD